MSFRICYFIAVCLAHIIAIVFLPLLLFKRKYRTSLVARLLLWGNAFPSLSKKQSIHFWFHACSFGEVNSLEPLIAHLRDDNRPLIILITTITQTGFNKAHALKRLYSTQMMTIFVRYLPFETLLPFWVGGNVDKLVVLEAELWYMLFAHLHQRGTKTVLLNARISTRSFPRYQKFRWFYAHVWSCVDDVFAQSEQDKQRLEALGADRVIVMGNLKILNLPSASNRFSKPASPLIVLASTHHGEEQMIFDALRPLYENSLPPFSLLVAPRHPERFDDVYRLMCETFPNQAIKRRSDGGDFLDSKLILADSLGELIEFYSIATVVVLGGSFVPVGGHNPLEIAVFQKPLLSGKAVFNQTSLFECIEGYELIDIDELLPKIRHFDTLSPTKIRHMPTREHFFAILEH